MKITIYNLFDLIVFTFITIFLVNVKNKKFTVNFYTNFNIFAIFKLLLVCLIFASYSYIQLINPFNNNLNKFPLTFTDFKNLISFDFITIIYIPIAEETFFRAYLLNLSHKTPFWIRNTLISCIFASLHYFRFGYSGSVYIFTIFALGYSCGILYKKYGLASSIILHILFNTFSRLTTGLFISLVFTIFNNR